MDLPAIIRGILEGDPPDMALCPGCGRLELADKEHHCSGHGPAWLALIGQDQRRIARSYGIR